MDDFPKFEPMDMFPFAGGLSDEDIHQLLRLVRTQTDEKILEIRSKRNNARVITGFLADGEAGDGHMFDCLRSDQGWTIHNSGEWIA